MAAIRTHIRRLLKASSGIAAVEFGLAMPVLTALALYGTETVYLTMVTSRVHQVAMQVADNASRIGDTSTLQNRKIYESDINDVFSGADKAAGPMVGLLQNGRVIISSLEKHPGNGRQYIHWQRCKGLKNQTSSYGVEGDGQGGTTITGIGPTGNQVSAADNDAVIFVEVVVDYKPLIPTSWMANKKLSAIASFNVRDSRDLTNLYQTSPAATVARCNVFSAT